MGAKNNYLKIGIFVLVALALFIVGLLAFGAKSYFSSKTRFETGIEGDVSGLSVGSGVELRGVPIGKVTRITFSWHAYPGSKSRLLVVEFEVDGDLMPWPPGDLKMLLKEGVARGLRAIVKGQGITGTSLLALDVVTPPPPLPELDYTPHYYYVPSAPGQFTRILETIEKALDNIQEVDFATISQGITNALVGVRELAQKLDKLDLQAVATNANSLLVAAKNTAVKSQDAVGQIQETLKGMKLEQIAQNANGLVSDLHDTNVRLQVLLAKLNAVPMRDTFGDLQQMLQTLNDVLLELKRYPAGFFLGEPPVPARGVQPVRELK